MKVTVSFANPFTVTAYTGTALAIGWTIGAHWGHTTTAVWMSLIAAIFLYLHDVAIALLVAVAIARASSSSRT